MNWSALQELDGYTDYERRIAHLARDSEDSKEGPQAFREKRDPVFVGR